MFPNSVAKMNSILIMVLMKYQLAFLALLPVMDLNPPHLVITLRNANTDRDLMQVMKSVNDMKAQLEVVQLERDELWNAIKPLADLFRKPEDAGTRRWMDVVKDI